MPDPRSFPRRKAKRNRLSPLKRIKGRVARFVPPPLSRSRFPSASFSFFTVAVRFRGFPRNTALSLLKYSPVDDATVCASPNGDGKFSTELFKAARRFPLDSGVGGLPSSILRAPRNRKYYAAGQLRLSMSLKDLSSFRYFAPFSFVAAPPPSSRGISSDFREATLPPHSRRRFLAYLLVKRGIF